MAPCDRPLLHCGRMDTPVERIYQQIGHAAIGVAGDDLAGKLLVYAEVQDGVISADVAYLSRQTGGVRLRVGPAGLKRIVYEFWQLWREQPQNQEWRVMCYVIDDGRFGVDLTYPDDLSADEGVSDRRPRAIRKYFGTTRVDYVRP
jgi:hypothetical protein